MLRKLEPIRCDLNSDLLNHMDTTAFLVRIVLKLAQDTLRQVFFDLGVARYRLADLTLGILIPVVLAAVPDQDTT